MTTRKGNETLDVIQDRLGNLGFRLADLEGIAGTLHDNLRTYSDIINNIREELAGLWHDDGGCTDESCDCFSNGMLHKRARQGTEQGEEEARRSDPGDARRGDLPWYDPSPTYSSGGG